MLSRKLSTPPNWSYQSKEDVEVELSTSSTEYMLIKLKLKGESLQYLKKITRVQNPYLFHRYMIRKLEYESLGIPYSEHQLVHATSEYKIPSIIRDNLDWRLVSRAKFGQGVSFSSCPSYANKQCSRSNGMERAMIFAKVLVGRKYPGRYSLSVPPKMYDTTYGNGNYVYVKYYDDEFYPQYVAYYDNMPTLSFLRIY